LRAPLEPALRAAVGVGDDTGDGLVAAAGGDGHGQRVEDELGAHVVGHRVAQQPTGPQVEDRRQVEPAFSGRDVGDVLAPGDIGGAGSEAAADQVGDLVAVGSGEGGATGAAPVPAGHAVQAHQAGHPLGVHDQAALA
jgi:hypothetical protein